VISICDGDMDAKKKLTTDDLPTALIHLYRGEIQRVNTWRNRLDTTPHWAIILVAGIISWTFSSSTRSPSLILLALPPLAALLLLESRRYQVHEIWRSRLRLLEENFLANLCDPKSNLPRKEWLKVLADDLRVPEHKSTLREAIAVRLRRIYLWLFLTLFFAWFFKLSLHPHLTSSLRQVMARASLGLISGLAVFASAIAIITFLTLLAVWGLWQEEEERKGEVLEEEPGYEWRRREERVNN